ncbi:MAG: glycosyltransferase [Rikenellaceae bacterium]
MSIDISVIVPIYGVEKYIEKCLRSLFSQTKTEGVEFILVNDCTKDNSMFKAKNIIKEFPHLNISIISHEINGGLACARNTGIAVAQGEYIQHIDSDDWVEPTMLEELYKKAKETNADIVGFDYCVESANGTTLFCIPLPQLGKDCLREMLSTNVVPSICFKLIKRELYLHKNVTFFLPGVDTWEDFIASVKLFYYAKKVAYINSSFYHYVQIDNNSISRSGFSQKKIDNIITAIDDMESFFLKSESESNFRKNIIDRKIYAKHTILKISGQFKSQYVSIFPEVDRYIFQQKGMPFHNRIALYFATHKCLFMYSLITKCVLLMKRILK